jgi:CheY-like chemotaxis protein
MAKTQILIAEDDPLVSEDLKARLEGLQYLVPWTTTRAEEAVAIAQRCRPDLVLMDIQLAGDLDGTQAAAEIRSVHIPVVYVTGCCDGPLFQRAKVTDPCGYVVKPYEDCDLQVAIEVGLHKHRAEQERQHLLEKLKYALEHVKTLTGLLSICAYCKKIKEDEEVWSQIEAYIMKHSSASFTHGMCPDCFGQVMKQLEATEQAGVPAGSLVLG